MTKQIKTKKTSFIKSIINRYRKKKLYVASLEAELCRYRRQEDMRKLGYWK